jgi:hypothetical protein
MKKVNPHWVPANGHGHRLRWSVNGLPVVVHGTLRGTFVPRMAVRWPRMGQVERFGWYSRRQK